MTTPNANPKAADNALRAIETALQELVTANISQAEVMARWGTAVPSADPAHGAAIAASLGRRGVS